MARSIHSVAAQRESPSDHGRNTRQIPLREIQCERRGEASRKNPSASHCEPCRAERQLAHSSASEIFRPTSLRPREERSKIPDGLLVSQQLALRIWRTLRESRGPECAYVE